MKRWRWGILLFELFLLVLILVLPQVNLPDFDLHRGAALTLARSRVSPPPVFAVVLLPAQYQQMKQFGKQKEWRSGPERHLIPRSMLSLLCTLLC